MTKPNASKQRVEAEFNDELYPGAWITAGCTIKNYVPPSVLAAAIDDVYGERRQLRWTGDPWVKPLANTGGDVDKVRIAGAVCGRWPATTASPLADLEQRINHLIEFSRHANQDLNSAARRTSPIY